ncbi:MAG TPA: RidA family protein [Acidimicrobiales bacterium]|nr:RidA family protein [Acidimicrobiales bacterium]
MGLYPGVAYEYARVVREGALVFTAGASPLDEEGVVVSPGDHTGQARRVVENLLAVLEEHGAGVGDIVRTTVYVVGGRDDLVAVWDVVAAGLAPARPPSTLLGVSVLGYPDQLVEVDAVAALP